MSRHPLLVIAATLFACGGSGSHSISTPTDHRPTNTAACSAVGACATDADCPSGTACVCEATRGVGSSPTSECLPSSCRVDADCGGGQLCSPSIAPGGPGGCGLEYFGYDCHTAGDECGIDADCKGDTTLGSAACMFVRERGIWACTSYVVCAG
jgi:hypothetical protein